jgi:hypothetical protein
MAGAFELEMMKMTDASRVVYFRSANGIHEVRLPPVDAALAVGHHPHEWSYDANKFADPPEGFVFSESNGGGLGRIAGASVRAD